MTGIGHNNPPKDRTFKKRWATALFAHPEKPMGAIAMGFKLYMEMDGSGCGAVISDREFSDCCGVSERACQNFKRWLLDSGFVRIQVKGARGRANAFMALIPGEQIPAPDAATREQIAASITGKDEECRHPLPAKPSPMPATGAVDGELTAPHAGNPPRAPAYFESPTEINIPKKQIDKQLLPEQEAACGGGDCDAQFPALNGTAVDIVKFISKHTQTTEPEARRMLKTNIGAYGSGAMMEAFSTTVAEMTTNPVAAPYKYLLGCARNAKEGKSKTAKATDAQQRQATLKQQNEKLRTEYGFDKEAH